MARKLSRAQRKAKGITLSPHTGCWIKYQLDLRNIHYRTVAAKAGLSENMVSHFLTCRKNSPRLMKAVSETLGYKSFEKLVAASRGKDALTMGTLKGGDAV
jgi:hypothetical protein